MWSKYPKSVAGAFVLVIVSSIGLIGVVEKHENAGKLRTLQVVTFRIGRHLLFRKWIDKLSNSFTIA